MATLDMDRKEGGCCATFGGAGSPSNSVAWAEAYFHTKWHLSSSNRLAAIHQRPKWSLAVLCYAPLRSFAVLSHTGRISGKSQIPLHYPASEPASELVADLLASCQHNGIWPITYYLAR